MKENKTQETTEQGQVVFCFKGPNYVNFKDIVKMSCYKTLWIRC